MQSRSTARGTHGQRLRSRLRRAVTGPSPERIRARLEERGVERTYSIAFAPRSGSTVLSNVLASRSVGRAEEFFQCPFPSDSPLVAGDGTPEDLFVDAVVGWTRGGWFGSKLGHDHRAHLDAHIRSFCHGYERLDDVLPRHRWVHLVRRDVVGQAVSLVVAQRSGRWHLRATDARVPAVDPDDYDFFAVLAKVMALGADDANWRTWFTTKGVEPLVVAYEDLLEDPTTTLVRVAEHIGADAAAFDDVDLERDGGLVRISSVTPGLDELRHRFTEDFLAIGDPGQACALGPALERWTRFFNESGWLPRTSRPGVPRQGQLHPRLVDQ